ncbi:hypothetical protein WR25_25243 [Diploscapter pachys]|uniref:gamma-glutamylcyclotransferase n=1 Tax=Diploscapter pachys TaxID=2018661 RepID=A0A2A2LE84_9BILA|nr:hypothetical protein WR25_25243 [Diploscapter pachys]
MEFEKCDFFDRDNFDLAAPRFKPDEKLWINQVIDQMPYIRAYEQRYKLDFHDKKKPRTAAEACKWAYRVQWELVKGETKKEWLPGHVIEHLYVLKEWNKSNRSLRGDASGGGDAGKSMDLEWSDGEDEQKGAEYVCNGFVRDYALEFIDFSKRWQGALATIVNREGAETWGCVWKIPEEYSQSLDDQEIGYNRLQVEVITDQGPIQCRTYQFKDPNAKFGRPSPQYKMVIVSGAKEHDLPEGYLKKLENLEDNGYSGTVEVDIPLLNKWNHSEEK